MLLLIGFTNMTTVTIQNTFVPIARQVAEMYGLQSTTPVNMCALMFAIVAPFGTLLSMKLLQTYRLGVIIRIGCTIQFIAAMARMLSFKTGLFWPFIVCQFFMSIPGPIYVMSSTLIANRWFPDHQRAFAAGSFTIFLMLGYLWLFALSATFLNTFKDEEGNSDIEKTLKATIYV